MRFSVPYLFLCGGLVLLTAASLSFSTPHIAISGMPAIVMTGSPTESALRRELQEAQRRFMVLRARNFSLRQKLQQAEAQRDLAQAQLRLVHNKSVSGDMEDLISTDVMTLSAGELLKRNSQCLLVQIPLRPEVRIREERQ